jgi:hypothetical protein
LLSGEDWLLRVVTSGFVEEVQFTEPEASFPQCEQVVSTASVVYCKGVGASASLPFLLCLWLVTVIVR